MSMIRFLFLFTHIYSIYPHQFIYFVCFCFWEKDENDNGRNALSVTNNVPTLGGTTIDWSNWKLKYEYFFFSNSKRNPCCNSERLLSKLYKFYFCFVIGSFWSYNKTKTIYISILIYINFDSCIGPSYEFAKDTYCVIKEKWQVQL